MRGFRGSRAAQNGVASRFGHPDQQNRSSQGGNGQADHPHHSQKPALPEWLKTPETKAREAQEALEAKSRPPVQPVVKQQPYVKPKPELETSQTRPRPQLVAAKSAKPAARTAAAPAPTSAPKKRVAAAKAKKAPAKAAKASKPKSKRAAKPAPKRKAA